MYMTCALVIENTESSITYQVSLLTEYSRYNGRRKEYGIFFVGNFGDGIMRKVSVETTTFGLREGHGGGCSVGQVDHGPPEISVGWATMHLAPPITVLYVR